MLEGALLSEYRLFHSATLMLQADLNITVGLILRKKFDFAGEREVRGAKKLCLFCRLAFYIRYLSRSWLVWEILSSDEGCFLPFEPFSFQSSCSNPPFENLIDGKNQSSHLLYF